jgi:hypothetical protein
MYEAFVGHISAMPNKPEAGSKFDPENICLVTAIYTVKAHVVPIIPFSYSICSEKMKDNILKDVRKKQGSPLNVNPATS